MSKGKLLNREELNNLNYNDKIYIDSKRNIDNQFNGVAIVKSLDKINGVMQIKPLNCDKDVLILHSISLPYIHDMFNAFHIYKYIEGKKEESVKQYTGIEILQMIKNRQLKVGDELIGYMPDGEQDGKFKVAKTDNGTVYISGTDEEDMDSWDLINMTFSIKEKEYLTFDEARESGKRFKYKEWDTYEHLHTVMLYLSGGYDETINEVLNEKAWEIQE